MVAHATNEDVAAGRERTEKGIGVVMPFACAEGLVAVFAQKLRQRDGILVNHRGCVIGHTPTEQAATLRTATPNSSPGHDLRAAGGTDRGAQSPHDGGLVKAHALCSEFVNRRGYELWFTRRYARH